ncbi:MAG: glycosyltransferase family 2 protein [Bacteroidota bacterium]|nr:glycosyltransferase family 2 protein [Bacteroidota bacterium]
MYFPKISIVTPSFNQAQFIEANIQSVVSQKYSDVEHIIIDGGSTDGTLDVLKKYNHLHWISEPDRGQSHGLNKGFKMAAGEIIGWLNSDDTFCPNVFQLVASKFEDRDVMVVYGDGFEVDENDKIIRPLYSLGASPEVLIRYWKWKYEFVQPAFFFRRNVFDEIGYLDERLYYAMDCDFFIRLGKRYKLCHVEKPIANFRLYPESKTGKHFLKFLPDYIWEMHKVSYRYWGKPSSLKYYSYLFSFLTAIGYSFLKNLFFSPTSKSRAAIKRKFYRNDRL